MIQHKICGSVRQGEVLQAYVRGNISVKATVVLVVSLRLVPHMGNNLQLRRPGLREYVRRRCTIFEIPHGHVPVVPAESSKKSFSCFLCCFPNSFKVHRWSASAWKFGSHKDSPASLDGSHLHRVERGTQSGRLSSLKPLVKRAVSLVWRRVSGRLGIRAMMTCRFQRQIAKERWWYARWTLLRAPRSLRVFRDEIQRCRDFPLTYFGSLMPSFFKDSVRF